MLRPWTDGRLVAFSSYVTKVGQPGPQGPVELREQSYCGSVEEVTERPRFVFVVHPQEEMRTLETPASGRERLVEVSVKISPEGDTGNQLPVSPSGLIFTETSTNRSLP